MAKFLLIGTNLAKEKVTRGIRVTEGDDHDIQAVGDIVGIYPDTHVFNSAELFIFDIIQVQGFNEKQLDDEVKVEMATAYQSGSEPWEWDLEIPKHKEVWKDTDGKWYFLENEPKFKRSITTLTEQEKSDLDSGMSAVNKKIILAKIKNKIKDDSLNLVEATDLNT